ncbi:Calcium-dependent protein kinase 2 [Durusdinium trenchii]
MRDAVGPYCCAQFVVQDAKVRERPVEFYQRMLRLVDGTLEHDLCFPGKVKRSTHCYGMEFTWHLVFGEDYETPLRQDDQRLPLPLRLKFGNEFIRRQWNDVVLNPSTPKKIVEEVNYDQMTVR